ncbi:MAG TPA: uroporphyrinogen decarboxylase family protein [Phycisphaerae bacterium]|nr:uroporphyrinogen decarboxylase family protein [Phycisphaerae bacterium]
MAAMTSRERIARILERQPVDRIGAHESFWPDTLRKWAQQGHVKEDESLHDHFGLDIRGAWPLNVVADMDATEEIVEETDETKLVRNGNGALLRWWKNKSGTPEHVDFLVQDRAGWDEHTRPHLLNGDWHRRRINFETYRDVRAKCRRENLFFCWNGVPPFECMHPVCGHEHMLIGMALDPDWVRDMCEVYTELTINLMEILFAAEGLPDGAFFFEDMGFKGKPFMSPAMYKEIVWPSHKRLFDYAHSKGLPVIVHSCGFVEPLVPGLIEAGMDCLQAMEVKAGMDLVELKKAYGDRIAFMGGLDIRTLVANDRAAIQAELDRKLPVAMAGGGYCLHSDHSVPDQVEYETYRFFLERGLEMGTYR